MIPEWIYSGLLAPLINEKFFLQIKSAAIYFRWLHQTIPTAKVPNNKIAEPAFGPEGVHPKLSLQVSGTWPVGH